MKIVFFGTPDFAVAALDKLVQEKCNIVGVVTSPDKPSGRGLQVQMSAVKQYCLTHGLNVLQPVNLKDEQFVTDLKALGADLQIVVAFRMLPELIWNMPPMGTYNLHASLLPKYRGAAPINWSIINGDHETGVTTFKLQHQIDTGKILLRDKVTIHGGMTAGDLHDVLMVRGAELLWQSVKIIEQACIHHAALPFMDQDENEVSHAPKIFKNECKIKWDKPAGEIHNLIRGLSPVPGAYALLNNGDKAPKQVKIYVTEVLGGKSEATNGSLITDNKNYIHVSRAGEWLAIKEWQVEGKKRMVVADFLKGYKLAASAKLE